MIRSALPFFVVGALVEGPLGFGSASGTSPDIVRAVLVAFAAFVAISLLVGLARRA